MGFLHQKGLGGWQGHILLRGGGNPRFWNPHYNLGHFEIPKIIIGVRGDKCGFFTPEGVRWMPGVSPTKLWGQSKVLNPLLGFWVFWKKYPSLVGSEGQIGVGNNLGETHLLGINMCKFHWFWVIFTPNMNLKLFSLETRFPLHCYKIFVLT